MGRTEIRTMNTHDLLDVIVRATGLVLFALAALQALNVVGRIFGIQVASKFSLIGDLWGLGMFVILGFVFIRHADRNVSLAYRNGQTSKDLSN
jgi:hypothetical protein